jgi:hypothetical protein
MIVTFTSKASASVTMFGDIALQLLKLMGHSGTVPGALRPEDIPAALQHLEAGLSRQAAANKPANDDDSDQEPAVGLSTRAGPLLDLLRASAAAGCHVMWDKQ